MVMIVFCARICISLILFFALLPSSGIIQAQTKVACIGNSITYGYGLTYNQNYPTKLQNLLGTSKYTVENDGVNSTTMIKNGNPSYWKNGRLPQVFSFQPKIVILKLGTNDTKPENWDLHYKEFKTDYLAMVDTLAGMASKPRIFVVLPVPVFNNPVAISWGIRDSVIKKEMPIISQIATERNLIVIDCNTPLLPFAKYFTVDGVHPDSSGADTIAHIVYRAIIATSTEPKPLSAHQKLISVTIKAGALSILSPLNPSSTVELFDVCGRNVFALKVTRQENLTINTSPMKNGIYILRIKNALSNELYCQRVDIVK